MDENQNTETTRGFRRPAADNLRLANGHNYLLVIGIDRYRSCPPLFNAVQDAREVMQVLQEKYQFDPEHTTMLFNEEATQAAIYRTLERLAQSVTSEDNLLIYFSGHGEFNKIIKEGFWIPVDGDLDNPGTFLPFGIFSKYIKAIPAFHIVVIADSCYAGSLFTGRNLRDVSLPLQRLYGIPSRWLLTAGRNEVVSDGEQGKNSPFAESLLTHLRLNREAALPISELCQLVVKGVSSNARQIPRGEPIQGVGHQGGEFLFLEKGVQNFQADIDTAAVKDLYHELSGEPEEAPSRAGDSNRAPFPPPVKEPETFSSVAAIQDTLRNYLVAGEFPAIYRLFDRIIDQRRNSLRSDLILSQAQYNENERKIRNGLTTAENASVTTNRIRAALAHYIDDLQADDVKPGIITGA